MLVILCLVRLWIPPHWQERKIGRPPERGSSDIRNSGGTVGVLVGLVRLHASGGVSLSLCVLVCTGAFLILKDHRVMDGLLWHFLGVSQFSLDVV